MFVALKCQQHSGFTRHETKLFGPLQQSWKFIHPSVHYTRHPPPLTQAVQEFTPLENYSWKLLWRQLIYNNINLLFFYWILLFYSFIYYMQFKHYYISRYVIFFTWFLVDLIINIVHFRSVNYLVYRARVIKKGEQHPNFWIKGLH